MNSITKSIVFLWLACSFYSNPLKASKNDSLRYRLEKILKPFNATVGIAIINLEDGDTLTINNNHQYPMQSVYKFHLALAVLHQVDKGIISLNQKAHISKEELRPKTWSPLREKHPDGNIDITVGELLNYSVSKSDNNACDILFRLVKGTKSVDEYIHQQGITEIAIAATEEEMSKDWETQYTNWTQPFATVKLLDAFYNKKIISDSICQFLMSLMIESSNSENRIKGLLPKETIVAHKTGSSNTNEKGMTAAVNDIGIITLPNGKHLAIAVFVSDTMEKFETNEKIIAEITKVTFDNFNNPKQ